MSLARSHFSTLPYKKSDREAAGRKDTEKNEIIIHMKGGGGCTVTNQRPLIKVQESQSLCVPPAFIISLYIYLRHISTHFHTFSHIFAHNFFIAFFIFS